MKNLLFLLFIFLGSQVFAQLSRNIDSVMVWRDASKGADGLENVYNEIWGFAKDGREYGILGVRDGAYIIDITNVRKPNLVEFIPGRYDFGVNRDYHDFNGYLYMVCDQGPSSLQIADLSYLPDSVPVVYDSDSMIIQCHNIFIDTTSARMYACGVTIPDTGNGKRVDLQIYDLSQSYVPTLLHTYDNENVEEFHDIWVRNNTGIGNNGRTGLFFYDFTDPENPIPFYDIRDYPDKGYNHAGYANVQNDHYYFGDETMGTDLKVVKLNEYNEPEVIKTFNSGKNTESIVAHNLLVRDSFLFVSYYHEGLQVFDISDPANPVKKGYYETFTRSFGEPPMKDYSSFDGAWGVYPYLPSGYILVSDRAKGMFIFDIGKIDGNYHPELLPRKSIFPNPARSYLDIVYPPERVKRVLVADVNGRIVEDSDRVDDVKNVSRYYFKNVLSPGVYIIRIEAESEVFSEAFVVE